MKRLEEKHPLAIRWFHWLNFPLLAAMIWSGLLIYWASSDEHFSNGVYSLHWGPTVIFHFFPPAFWHLLGLQSQLAKGMAWHFFFMWLFAINGVAYVGYTVVSGEWRCLVPNRHAWLGALHVLFHDLHLIRKVPVYRGYNPAQQIAYTLVILMGAGSLVTGLAVYRPVTLGWLTTALGGYQRARWEHFALTMGYVLFFIIHVVQVARAGWGNFRSMIVGYAIDESGRANSDR